MNQTAIKKLAVIAVVLWLGAVICIAVLLHMVADRDQQISNLRHGDLNLDGQVDAKDLSIFSENYGKTLQR